MKDKNIFNMRLRNILNGIKTEPLNLYENKVFDLIYKIEACFDRIKYPGVYEGLLAIHDAQEKSLQLHHKTGIPSDPEEILKISIEKGGTSVLADGYLVLGEMDYSKADFAFGYGVLLQFADDLQDMTEDLENQHQTIFTNIHKDKRPDELVNKLNRFITKVLANVCTKSPSSFNILNLIESCCGFLIMDAVSRNRVFFSDKFVNRMEKYSLTRFKFREKVIDLYSRKFSEIDFDKIIGSMMACPELTDCVKTQ